MKSAAWIGFAAARYITAKRRDGASPSSLLAVLGIGVGVMALTVVLAVMNGFQLGFIESILEISSFHLRITAPAETAAAVAELESLRALPEVAAALPFAEVQTIARGSRRSQQACLVRGVPRDAADRDPGLAGRLEFESGDFDLTGPGSVLLGAELALRLGVGVGDDVSFFALSGSADGGIVPESAAYVVTGLFRSGFYEYDLSWAFIGLDEALALSGDSVPTVGLKLRDRWADAQAVSAIRAAGLGGDRPVQSWREYNRAFFGALRLEKLLIFVLVGLIFVVVGLNVFQAQRRTVQERADEIGLLRAVGASELAVRLVFTIDGLIVGAAGAGVGLTAGLAIAWNIGPFFAGLEAVVNAGLAAAGSLAALLPGASGGAGGQFSVYSPAVFYIKEIPSRVLAGDVAAVVGFGIAAAVSAAWLASGRVARFRPAEVLRYE